MGAEGDELEEVGRSRVTDLIVSLKDFKQGTDVSRFAIRPAASGSRREGATEPDCPARAAAGGEGSPLRVPRSPPLSMTAAE